MKVYIVTSGDYSDYKINKVFFNKEKARYYQMINYPNDGDVEEYEVSDNVVEDEQRKRPVKVQYSIQRNRIVKLNVCNDEHDMNQIKFDCCEPYYIFSLKLGTGRLFNNVMRYGRDSKMLLKIAQDRLAKHLYERGSSREEIIQRAEEMFYDKYGSHPYHHISTSIPEAHDVQIKTDPLADAVNKRLHDMIKNGEPLPDSIEDLYKQEAEKLGCKVAKVVQDIKLIWEVADDTESNS